MISAPTDSPHVLRAGQPSAERRRHEAYPFTATMQARYGDMDVNGHLNNLALESVHEDLRAHLNRRVFPDIYDVDHRDYRLVTAQNVVHFLAEGHWPASITASAGIGHIGRSSFVACTGLFIDDKVHQYLRHNTGPRPQHRSGCHSRTQPPAAAHPGPTNPDRNRIAFGVGAVYFADRCR